MSYINKANVQNYLMININASFDTQISDWGEAAESFINNYCNRVSFEQESETEKYYDGNGTRELLVDDILTITKIEMLDDDGNVNYTLDDSTEYYLYPSNKTPKTSIIINTSNAPMSIFLRGYQNIKVTGTFGYAVNAPKDIVLAATRIVAQIISDKNLDIAGNIKSEKLGEYSVTFTDVDKIADKLDIKKDILDRYRKISVI